MNSMIKQSFRPVIIGVCLGTLLLAGCSVYRPELHQGQTLKQEDIDQVTAGMSPQEVREILGTPLVTDVFNTNRWDYVYNAYDQDRNQTDLARVTIFFVEGVVEKVESDSEMPQNAQHLEALPEREKKGWFSSFKKKASNFWKKRKDTDSEDESSEAEVEDIEVEAAETDESAQAEDTAKSEETVVE